MRCYRLEYLAGKLSPSSAGRAGVAEVCKIEISHGVRGRSGGAEADGYGGGLTLRFYALYGTAYRLQYAGTALDVKFGVLEIEFVIDFNCKAVIDSSEAK